MKEGEEFEDHWTDGIEWVLEGLLYVLFSFKQSPAETRDMWKVWWTVRPSLLTRKNREEKKKSVS